MMSINNFSIFLFFLNITLSLYYLSKGLISNFAMLFCLGIVAAVTDIAEVRLMLFLFIVILGISMVQIKLLVLDSVYEKVLNKPFYWFLFFIIITVNIGIKDKISFDLMEIVAVLIEGAFVSFFWGITLFVSIRGLYTLYIFCKHPSIQVSKFSIDCLEPNKNEVRRLPFFTANVICNKKLELYYVTIGISTYLRIKSNLKLNITKYKTDGKGNYIFF